MLADQAAILKNTALLNDCKPTAEFLNMEKRKSLGSNEQMNLPNLKLMMR